MYKSFESVIASTPVDAMLMGVYYFKLDGEVVYIGISNNLGSRLRKHWKGASCGNLNKYKEKLYVKLDIHADANKLDSYERTKVRKELEIVEVRLIKSHNPKWNIRKKEGSLKFAIMDFIKMFK